MLIYKPCVDAFQVTAQIPTPAEQIRDRGLILAPFDLLRSSNSNVKLGIDEPRRQEILSKENFKTDAITDNRPPGPVYTFFYFWAKPNFPFDEVFPHERIHGSGVGKQYSVWQYFFGFYGHDLTGYEHYQKIIDNCRIPEGVK